MTATDTSPVSVASYFVICTSSDAYILLDFSRKRGRRMPALVQ